MSLSDRLAAAARARGDVGGERTATAVEPPADASRVQLILSASRPAATVEPDPTAAPDAICPTCSRTGVLGVVDLPRRTADWACDHCGSMWRVMLPAPAPGELLPPIH